MAEIITIARPYAEAVFKLARETNKLDEWSAALGALSQVASTGELRALLGDPRVSDAQLNDIVVAATRAELPADVKNFVQVLIDNDRLEVLPQVRQLFETLKHEHEGVVDAQIASAFALDDAQLKTLVADLEARFKRKVNPQVSVDQSLIGGVRIEVGDDVIDASVRGKLEAMSAALAKI